MAILARRGLVARAWNVDYVTRRGAAAGRFRMLLKAIVFSGPVILIPALSFALFVQPGEPPEVSGPDILRNAMRMIVPVAAGLTLWSSLLTRRGLSDYVCGTYPVPR